MVPIDSTKRRFSDIWPQLAVSCCVLLAPPILMAAGFDVFRFSATAERAASRWRGKTRNREPGEFPHAA
jgi:hypothetical protein